MSVRTETPTVAAHAPAVAPDGGDGPASLTDLRHPGDVAISRNGGIAFAVRHATGPAAGHERSDIWTVADAGAKPLPRTDGDSRDERPRWSPDGRTLAFLSDAGSPGRSVPSLLSEDGGLRRLECGAASAEDVAWSPDGRRLLVLASEPGADQAGVRSALPAGEAAGPGPEVLRPGTGRRTLSWIDVETGATWPLELDLGTIWEVDLSRTGRQLVALASDDPTESGWYDARLVLADLGSGRVRTLRQPADQAQCPRLSPDERAVALIESPCSDRGIVCGTIILVDVATGTARPVPTDFDVAWLAWADDGSLRYVARSGCECLLGALRPGEDPLPATGGRVSFGLPYEPQAAIARDGETVAFARETATEPAELFVRLPGGEERQLTELNAALRIDDPPRVEEIAWRARDGERIGGLLIRPLDLEPRAPGVVMVHGGPTSTWSHSFGALRHAMLLAGRGFAVLAPNPRGSSGRGAAFAAAVVGDMGGADLEDVVAGVDELARREIVDPGRVGIAGRSYGGYMAAAAATGTDRFAAAVAIACVSDWVSFVGTSNIARFAELFLPLTPGVGWERAVRRSPALRERPHSTPTLILHGAGDRCTPPGQARELFAALSRVGADCELVVYPGEGHFLSKREHAIDAHERMRSWFERHLARNPTREREPR